MALLVQDAPAHVHGQQHFSDGRDVLLKPFCGISTLELTAPKLEQERRPPRYQRSSQRRRLSRAYALLLLGAGVCRSAALKKEYMIYIDAGSSATRAFVYSWEARDYDYHHLPPAMVRPERVTGKTDDFLEVTPGVSEYAESPEKLQKLIPGNEDNNGLQKLLTWVIEKFKEIDVTDPRELSEIPLYLGCTAGVRILPRSQREDLMAALRRFFTSPSSESPFLKDETFIRIIPGQEEGVYGWLAANYLMDTLGGDDTWGILDLGGASTQITFRPDSPNLVSNVYEVRLTDGVGDLPGMISSNVASKERPGTVRLFSHSFLYFGQEQALQRLDAKLLQFAGDAAREEVVKDGAKWPHPCLPRGAVRRWNVDTQKFLPADFVRVSDSLEFEGTSNFTACYPLALALMEIGTHPCYRGEWPGVECGMVGQVIPKPPHGRKFLAVSSLWHLQEFLRPILQATTGVSEAPWPLKVWRNAIKAACEKDFEEIKEHNKLLSKPMPEKYLPSYCALGAYAFSLLKDGYGFELDSEQMYPVKTVGDQEFDIGFGFVLKHANDLPWRLSEQQQRDSSESIGMFAAWMSFFGAVLGGGLIAVVHPRVARFFDLTPRSVGRSKRKEQSEYGVELVSGFRSLRYSTTQTSERSSGSARDSFVIA